MPGSYLVFEVTPPGPPELRRSVLRMETLKRESVIPKGKFEQETWSPEKR
jgi:hypothetical protein